MRNSIVNPDGILARVGAATPPHTLRPWPLPTTQSPRIQEFTKHLSGCSDEVSRQSAINEMASDLAQQGLPLWEEDRAEFALVTFIWRGRAPHGVALQLNRMTDPIDIVDTVLAPISGSDFHSLTLRVPDDWMGSYLFVPLAGPPELVLHRGVDSRALAPLMGAATEDPFALECITSKPVVGSPVFSARLAVARAPKASELSLWRDDEVAVTVLESVRSEVSDAELPLSFWSHPDADAQSSVVLLTDGEVWRSQFPIIPELSRRVDRGECEPFHLVFLESGGPRQRQLDYASTAEESGMLLTAVRARLGTSVGEGPWVVAGQSLGGLFAALCAVRHHEHIRAAIAQSPSLWWPSAAVGMRGRGWFEECSASADGAPVLLHCGNLDWTLIDRARDAAALLGVQDALLEYREFAAGHDILQWQAALPDALVATINHLSRSTNAAEI